MKTVKKLESEGWEVDEESRKAEFDRKTTLALNNSVASVAAAVEKIANVDAPKIVDIDPVIQVHSKLMKQVIGELKKIANIKGWQKIGMHFERNKQGVISTATIERIK
jgi:hypothetical protein